MRKSLRIAVMSYSSFLNVFERVEDYLLDTYTACLHVLHDIFVFIVACTVSFEYFDDAQVSANCCDVVLELFERIENCFSIEVLDEGDPFVFCAAM